MGNFWLMTYYTSSPSHRITYKLCNATSCPVASHCVYSYLVAKIMNSSTQSTTPSGSDSDTDDVTELTTSTDSKNSGDTSSTRSPLSVLQASQINQQKSPENVLYTATHLEENDHLQHVDSSI